MKPTYTLAPTAAWGLLFMRVSTAIMVLLVHGLPKLQNWNLELHRIEDPLGLGPTLTLSLAVFAEVLCPVLLILGVYARLACLPMLVVLHISLLLVHPDWTLEQGQFAWLLTILFTGLAITGPGPYALRSPNPFKLRWAQGSQA